MAFSIDTDKGKLYTTLKGKALLFHPLLNKGTAFTQQERDELNLIGKLPARVETLDEQINRVEKQLERFQTQQEKSIFLHVLFNTNEILFYAFVRKFLSSVIATLYTPTVGSAVQNYSTEYRHPRGIYISYKDKGKIRKILSTRTNPDIDLIVISDGEGVLGIGDQGIGGIGIPVAKLVMYVVSGCCSPYKCLPVLVDVGTNNAQLLNDEMYLGLRQKRIEKEAYHLFMDEIVNEIKHQFPNALVHWEDFAKNSARRHLSTYDNSVPCFNDDIQGTAVVVIAAILTALARKKAAIEDMRIVIVGAGSAGMGIANLMLSYCVMQGMTEQAAKDLFWIVDRYGLMCHGQTHLGPTELVFAREENYHKDWQDRSFETVVEKIKPTILIGCSTVGGFFNENLVKQLASDVNAPIIMPLSNPSKRSEAHPHDLYDWTNAKAFVATGSPFPPYERDGVEHNISQCNNLFAFPGIGAGMIAAKANKLTDTMLIQAANAIKDYILTTCADHMTIMPDVTELEKVSKVVASAVASGAVESNVTELSTHEVNKRIEKHFWQPSYCEYLVSEEKNLSAVE